MDEHYIGHACNHVALSICVGINCYKGYMVFICVGEEEHPKPIWLVKASSSSSVVPTNPNFSQMEVEIVVPIPNTGTCSAPI